MELPNKEDVINEIVGDGEYNWESISSARFMVKEVYSAIERLHIKNSSKNKCESCESFSMCHQ